LVEFMTFTDDRSYASDGSFDSETLLKISPEDVCRWMNFRAFGEPDPSEDAKPINARSSTLEYAKKAISAFMPRSTVPWDPIRKEGNPTRSDPVNKVIKSVKRFEVRREGVQSAARRPIEYAEFLELLGLVRASTTKGWLKYLVGGVLTLQWHLITRIDDMMKLKFDSFAPNVQYPGTLTCQLRWSKNISEERDAPEQILLGSLDPRVCVLLNIAVYLEASGKESTSEYLFGNAQDGDRVVRRFLQEVFNSRDFHKLKPGNLGTHSLRKGAATYGSRSGLPKDYINRRGRWRTRKSIVDVYIDNTQPYPDAVAAATLAGPLGPCLYVLKKGVACVTDTLLVDHIASSIMQRMDDNVARVLALPLLWAALVADGSFEHDLIPKEMKERIVRAYVKVGGNTATNPVSRVPIHVSGDGSQLKLVELQEENTGEALEHSLGGMDTSRKEFAAVHSQLFSVQRQVSEVMNETLRLRTEMQRGQQKMLSVLRRIAIQPIQRPTELQDETVRPRTVTLSKRPKDLYELWHEFEFGLNGAKAAKLFTAAERGGNKFAYSRRKTFWDVVVYLVRAGFTSDVAIDKVYAAYGRQHSVTSILLQMRSDRRTGGHPELRE
ncbi:hypothetical protein PHMEG_0002469, partial [Phytophthora megakarya]